MKGKPGISPDHQQINHERTHLRGQLFGLWPRCIGWFTRLGFLKKRHAVHASLLGLMAAAAWQGQTITTNSQNNLLYALVTGDEVVEGPLDPKAYAQTEAPGVGGARLGVIEADANVDVITFQDPEVSFAATLGGNAIIGPLNPLPSDPDAPETPTRDTPKPRIYTVESGDTIASIAQANNVSVATILSANGLYDGQIIKVGDHVTILPTSGVQHTVKSGDTVLGLAQRYDIAAKDIVAYNQLEDSARLSIGEKLIIPGAEIRPVTRQLATRDDPVDPDATPEAKPDAAPIEADGFIWPTTTRHISQYFRWGHTGIDIDNRSRPAIYSALEGSVEFAGWLGGYGNLLIVNHGNGVQTYYGHLDKFYVGKGDSVTKGEAIGKMGSTGRSTGPHLHFEVRRNGQPINPMGMF